MAATTERPVVTYLRTSRPVDQQIRYMMSRAAADLRGALAEKPDDLPRYKRRRIVRRHLKRLYRNVGPVIFWGEQQATRAAVDSMYAHGALENREQALQDALLRNMENDNLDRLHNLLAGSLARVEARWMDGDVPRSIAPSSPGGVSYQIERIARTEMNRSFHETVRFLGQQSQLVVGFAWRVSNTHAHRDVCDRYAAHGTYLPHELPDKPHPFCLCYSVPETVFASSFRETRVPSSSGSQVW